MEHLHTHYRDELIKAAAHSTSFYFKGWPPIREAGVSNLVCYSLTQEVVFEGKALQGQT